MQDEIVGTGLGTTALVLREFSHEPGCYAVMDAVSPASARRHAFGIQGGSRMARLCLFQAGSSCQRERKLPPSLAAG